MVTTRLSESPLARDGRLVAPQAVEWAVTSFVNQTSAIQIPNLQTNRETPSPASVYDKL